MLQQQQELLQQQQNEHQNDHLARQEQHQQYELLLPLPNQPEHHRQYQDDVGHQMRQINHNHHQEEKPQQESRDRQFDDHQPSSRERQPQQSADELQKQRHQEEQVKYQMMLQLLDLQRQQQNSYLFAYQHQLNMQNGENVWTQPAAPPPFPFPGYLTYPSVGAQERPVVRQAASPSNFQYQPERSNTVKPEQDQANVHRQVDGINNHVRSSGDKSNEPRQNDATDEDPEDRKFAERYTSGLTASNNIEFPVNSYNGTDVKSEPSRNEMAEESFIRGLIGSNSSLSTRYEIPELSQTGITARYVIKAINQCCEL
jgi:hypothetical protein